MAEPKLLNILFFFVAGVVVDVDEELVGRLELLLVRELDDEVDGLLELLLLVRELNELELRELLEVDGLLELLLVRELDDEVDGLLELLLLVRELDELELREELPRELDDDLLARLLVVFFLPHPQTLPKK